MEKFDEQPFDSMQEKGYVIAICDDSDFYIPNAEHIERNDGLIPWIYEDDEAAAKGAEQDGVKLIYGMDGVEDGVYIDTARNRRIIESVLHNRAITPASILAQLQEIKDAIAQDTDCQKSAQKRDSKSGVEL